MVRERQATVRSEGGHGARVASGEIDRAYTPAEFDAILKANVTE